MWRASRMSLCLSLLLGRRNASFMKEKMKLLPPSSLFGTPSSPTPSFEMITFTTPSTCSKEKGKAGKSVWEDPAIALGWDHIVITIDELRGLSSIPSYELVNCHIHKLVQVFYSATFYCWLSIYYWKNTYLFRIQYIRSGKLTDLLHSQLITFTM